MILLGNHIAISLRSIIEKFKKERERERERIKNITIFQSVLIDGEEILRNFISPEVIDEFRNLLTCLQLKCEKGF